MASLALAERELPGPKCEYTAVYALRMGKRELEPVEPSSSVSRSPFNATLSPAIRQNQHGGTARRISLRVPADSGQVACQRTPHRTEISDQSAAQETMFSQKRCDCSLLP